MKKVITHNGRFHTDEAFGVAVLRLVYGDIELVRTRDAEIIASGDIVLDVGGIYDADKDRFDHHQEGGAGEHSNGVPYSSFGLVWKKYGAELCGSQEVADVIKKRIVYPIDATDNGMSTFSRGERDDVYPYLMHTVTMAFRPAWNEDDRTYDEGFAELLEVVVKILSREIVHAKAHSEGKQKAQEAYEQAVDKRLIILDGTYPWGEVLGSHPEPLFVVSPKSTGDSWNVNTVNKMLFSFENRKDLPKAWAGKMGEELAQISGVPDAVFSHNKRFIAVAESKEGALALAKLALEE